MLSGFLILIYTISLRILATCGCMQGRPLFQKNNFAIRCKNIVEFFGGGILTFFSLISIVLVITTVIECWLNGIGFNIFVTVLIAKIFSFAFWIIWATPYFIYRYSRDKKRFLGKIEKRRLSKLAEESKKVSSIESGSKRVSFTGRI